MTSLSRRSLLSSLGPAVGLVAGCSAFQTESTSTSRLLELLALNYTTSQQTLHVIIEERDDFVYHESHRLKPGEPTDAAVRRFRGVPTKPGAYMITAWLDGQLASNASQLDTSEFDVDCMNLRVAIEKTDDGKAQPDVTLAFTTVDCPTDGTTTG